MNRKRQSGHVPRVYLEQPLTAGTQIELTGDRFHHLRNVLRLNVDDPVILFDGTGGEFPAHVTRLERRALNLACGDRREPGREPRLRITLGQAVARGDRMDYAIAKAVELGATRIQPLVTERTKVRLDNERGPKKQTHWRRVAIAAAEQSGRTRVPDVPTPHPLTTWLADPPAGKSVVLDPGAAQPLGGLDAPGEDGVTLLVGPESGLSEDETARAHAAGFVSAGLGPRVLRTETAGVACLTTMQALWGDLS